ncbi:androgen-dependent TFPI-regulating protein [Papilio machaon]|uniref:androgen-dependent TFPI-regulating protein n=1 Tax=Papilio machaon TaxID=76193 RepID=UPI001E664CEE|nr:androgen-dependent TFPI-regulating protein [Papilio machaon]
MLLPIFHFSAMAVDAYAFWYDQTYVDLPFDNPLVKKLPLKSRSMFLTMWCLILQITYHMIAFLNDVFGTNAASPKKKSTIRLIKDVLFSVAFPVAMYVSGTFWGIYAIDKDLIYPDYIAKLYPEWVNHILHTTIAIFMFIELLMTNRNYPSKKVGLSVMSIFIISYISFYLTVYFKTGIWAYPLFDELNWPLRIVFLLFSYLLVIAIYIFAEKLNYIVTGSKIEKKHKKH